MLQQQQPAAWAENPERLPGRGGRVRDRAETERAGDGVEALVRQIERLGVPDAKVDLAHQILGALAPDRGHLRAQLERRQLDSRGVEGQIPQGPRCQLQHLPLSP